jgi:hypothetical protein
MSQTQTTIPSGFARRALLLGTPLAYLALSIVHPRTGLDSDLYGALGGRVEVWTGVHVAQLVLIALLGGVIWTLTDGLSGAAARVARVAVVPYLVFYSAFDAFRGIATGLLVAEANQLGGPDQAAAARLIQEYFDGMVSFASPALWVVIIGAGSWLVAMGATTVAVRRAGAGPLPVALLAVAAVSYTLDHTFPSGTVAMAALFLAALLLERRRATLPAPQPTPAHAAR